VKTNFSSVQLARPEIAKANSILSKCTNCGCCNAACPTYEITGDEREAPRGRINLIREMLEQPGAPKPATVQHLDNCLSCLSCTVVCPSDVDYMHLIDHARVHIEETHKRPLGQRLTRQVLSYVLPHSKRFRAALAMGRLARPLSGLLRRNAATKSLSVMLDSLPSSSSSVPAGAGAGTHLAADKRLKRVILPGGCVQKVLDPGINRSTVNLLTGVGVEVVIPKSNDCCGALNYHLGKEDAALSQIRRNIDAWCAIIDTQNVDAIVITASGCGTTIMDYGNILKDNPQYAEKAARVSRLAMDVTTFLGTLSLPPRARYSTARGC
jgi:glycolate oxidase iron-sulfur subunit